jgi:hypothetical protein
LYTITPLFWYTGSNEGSPPGRKSTLHNDATLNQLLHLRFVVVLSACQKTTAAAGFQKMHVIRLQ